MPKRPARAAFKKKPIFWQTELYGADEGYSDDDRNIINTGALNKQCLLWITPVSAF